MDHTYSSVGVSDVTYQQAYTICKYVLNALGLRRSLDSIINQDNIPLADVEPLPAYAENDLRSSAMREKIEWLHMALRVVDGIRGALAPEDNPKTKHILFRYVSQRGERLLDAAKKQALPRAVATAWKENDEILRDLSDFLRHCVYDSERDLAIEAAQYAAERNVGAMVFLAICPNIPLIVPTLEARLLFTKPLQGLTKGIHAVFGRVIILGFFLLLIYRFASLFDELARMQVVWTHRFMMARWLRNERKSQQMTQRYLNDAVTRVMHPRRDAIIRGLLSIVS